MFQKIRAIPQNRHNAGSSESSRQHKASATAAHNNARVRAVERGDGAARVSVARIGRTSGSGACCSALPYVLIWYTPLVGLLDFYRRGLAQRLLADTNGGSTSAARVPSPFLATFPRAVQCPDLCDVLRVAWAERLKNLAKDIKVTNVSYLI